MELRDKLILLLSAPDVSDRELNSFCDWLSNGGVHEIAYQAKRIRSVLKDATPINGYGGLSSRSYRILEPATIEILDELTHLLIKEARMTKRQALVELADSVGYHERLPDRISFENGLLRLLEIVPSAYLIDTARHIRNRWVHSLPSPDWPLKEAKDEVVDQSDK